MPVLLTIILLFSAHSGWTCPYDLPTIPMDVKGHHLTLELATTPASKSCGLSHRASLPADRGMVFVYSEPELLTFWMKDTSIPLDIAFIDAAGRIVSIQKMDPFPITTVYSSPMPALYAIEVNQGWFEKNGISVGDTLTFDFPAGLEIR